MRVNEAPDSSDDHPSLSCLFDAESSDSEFLDHVLPTSTRDFSDAAYWKRRYEAETQQTYDWYNLEFATFWAAAKQVLRGHPRFQEIEGRWQCRGALLLEIGAGNSHWSTLLSKKGFTVFSTDIDHGVLCAGDRLKTESSRIHKAAADATKLPFRTHSFDIIFEKGTLDALSCCSASSFSAAQSLEECTDTGLNLLLQHKNWITAACRRCGACDRVFNLPQAKMEDLTAGAGEATESLAAVDHLHLTNHPHWRNGEDEPPDLGTRLPQCSLYVTANVCERGLSPVQCVGSSVFNTLAADGVWFIVSGKCPLDLLTCLGTITLNTTHERTLFEVVHMQHDLEGTVIALRKH